ncbi:MAG: plasma-membrane proton-efflux P-type ATPase [Thermoplasmatales archaeon]|nr:plasma-membrane proton-efflux P-type ATPase [Thermoplasmatales archaeon]
MSYKSEDGEHKEMEGLTENEAKERILKYGYNEIQEKKRNLFREFFKRFWGLTPWMLEITIVFSFLIHKLINVYIIAGLLVVNAIIGYTQEEKASKAVEILKNSLQINAKVLRDGKWILLKAREIVPGDVIRLRAGDFVPADVEMREGEELEIDQSALTGESLPISKKKGDKVYSGSIVRKGEGNGVVTATGKDTYFGKTTELVSIAKPKLHMEAVTARIVNYLLVIVVVLLGVIFIFSYFRKVDLITVVPLALMLLVFAVPVALPAMFTVSMAVGSLESAKKGALVTRLNAIEDAANMDVLCADKTGTLTQNKLTVSKIVTIDEFKENEAILYGYLASEEADNDPIDMAFIRYAKEKGISKEGIIVKNFKGFVPSTRRTEAQLTVNGKDLTVVKGAVETILELCKYEKGDDVRKKVNEIATQGERVIAVAVSENGNFRPVSLVGLSDPPRPNTKSSIKEMEELGIKVKMLTGDAEPIAKEISKIIGLGDKTVTGATIKELKIKDPVKAANLVEESVVFAEIFPEDKYTIVKGLQAKEHVVGMTGDGINDAPALKRAEVGIAVSNATDVAKGAASIILTSEGLTNIVDLVRIGRTTYQRIVTWVLNKVVKTFQVAVFIALGFIITGQFLLSALDIILFLFLIDFVTLSLSTDSMRGSNSPEKWDIRNLVKIGISLGAIQVSEMFLLLFIGLRYLDIGSNINLMNTFFFSEIMFFGLLTPIIVRENSFFWKSKPGKTLGISIIADMVLVSLLSLFGFGLVTKITITEFAVVLAYGLFMNLVVNDIFKIGLRKIGISR